MTPHKNSVEEEVVSHDNNGFMSKEKFFSWAMRVLTAVVMISMGIIGFFIQDKLGSFTHEVNALSESQKEKAETAWKAIQALTLSQNQMAISLGQLTTTVNDTIRTTAEVETRLSRIQDDHEQRIRSMESVRR